MPAGRCDKHRREARREADTRKPGERRVYDTRAWRDGIRPAQLRKQPLCEDHLKQGLAILATEVDHADGDPTNNASENLRSLCKACHSSKTAKHDGAFGRPLARG